MTTVGQFNRVWLHYTMNLPACFLKDEIKDELYQLFQAFAAEFEKQFHVNIHQLDMISPKLEIAEAALEKLVAWLMRVSQNLGEDYLRLCGLRPPFPQPPGDQHILRTRGSQFFPRSMELHLEPDGPHPGRLAYRPVAKKWPPSRWN